MEGDDATGMSHTLWRQFDNLSARWTSPDPYGGSMSVTSPQSFNRYSYVGNDPVNMKDPTGLMLEEEEGSPDQRPDEPPGDPFETGRSITAAAEARYDRGVTDTIEANRVNEGISSGDLTREQVEKTIKGNDNLEIEDLDSSVARDPGTGNQDPVQQQQGSITVDANAVKTTTVSGLGYPVYGSAEQAAIAALQVYNGDSIRKNREYAFAIFETIGGEFSFSRPNIRTHRKSTIPPVPKGTTRVAIAHTHAAFEKGAGNEVFSAQDRKTTNNLNVPSYLATPSGTILRFDAPGIKNSTAGKVTVLTAKAVL